MSSASSARKPALAVVREGMPGHRKPPESVILPEAEEGEPDWLEAFPSAVDELDQQKANRRAREVARRTWRRVAPVLVKSMGLSDVDTDLIRDYCICIARIDQCERDISTRGMLIQGERGWQKNGSTTVVAQYRTQLKSYIRELGLSPSARASIPPPKGRDDDDSDPFD